MKTFIDRLLRNPISFEITSIPVYLFYCLVFAIAAAPSAYIIYLGTRFLNGSFLMVLLLTLFCSVAFYVFLITSAIFVGFVERLLTLGIKPGAYPIGSPIFFRWLVYSGLHLWQVNLVLPFLRGNNWIKIYLKIAGAKIGTQSFINTSEIYDPYLLEIGREVLVGGEAFLNCHLYENGFLNLGKITIGDYSTIGAEAYLTPGTVIGTKSAVGIHTYLRRNTEIKDGDALMTPPGMSPRQIVKLTRGKNKQNTKE